MATMDIMFSDLSREAQGRVLEFYGVESESDLNGETMPLFVLSCEDGDPGYHGEDVELDGDDTL